MPNHDKLNLLVTGMDDSYEQPTAVPLNIFPGELIEEDKQDEAHEEMGLDWSKL